MDYTGVSNQQELTHRVHGGGGRRPLMLRRKRKEILPELPPKHREMTVLAPPLA